MHLKKIVIKTIFFIDSVVAFSFVHSWKTFNSFSVRFRINLWTQKTPTVDKTKSIPFEMATA